MAERNTQPIIMRKRQQIDHTSQIMFLWVAGSSVIIAFAIVAGIFLVQKALYVEKVLGKKNDTISTLQANQSSYRSLSAAIKDLRGDRKIGSTPSSVEGGNNLDKIFDALPYEGDSVALGSSLQAALLTGVSLESLTVDSTGSGDVPETDTAAAPASLAGAPEMTQVGSSQYIGFSFKVTGTDSELKTMFEKLNLSIRPIKIVNLQLEAASGDKITASVQAVTYYQPYKVFELRQESVKP